MSYTSPFTILASAARGAGTAYSGAVDLSDQDEAIVFLDVTAKSGTSPTLNVTIQTQDPLGGWYDLVSFTQATDVTKEAKSITIFGAKVRAKYVIAGSDTPTVTFSLTAIAKRK